MIFDRLFCCISDKSADGVYRLMIRMIGIDNNLAPVEIRSIFTFTKREMEEVMVSLKEVFRADGIVMLATCNRTEVWLSLPYEKNIPLFEELCRLRGVEPAEYRDFFVGRQGKDAIEHLFWLTTGLKSAIFAEDQIITQVKNALAFAHERRLADGVLEVLFRMAVTAAKKVKTKVRFTRADSTAIEQAIRKIQSEGFQFAGSSCMVIGNGEYGKLAASMLRAAGADVTMTVRQYHRGQVAVPEGCREIGYDERIERLPHCDIVVSATASPHYTIRREDVRDLAVDHEIILIDLAVPRDIDPKVAEGKYFRVYDIDDFHTLYSHENDVPFQQAAEIINAEISEFEDWYRGRDLVPRVLEVKDEAVDDFYLRIRKIVNKLPMEEQERAEFADEMKSACGRMLNKMFFELQDNISDSEFRDTVEGLEKIYE